jgi:hypothetical protein
MTARFIVRLVNDAGALLSWAEVQAEAKPQGRPRSTPLMALCPTQFVIERDGVAAQLVIHWADMDVVRVTAPMNPTPVQVGQVVTYTWLEPVWMVKGADADIPLAPVTVRGPVRVGIPAGGLGAVGTA